MSQERFSNTLCRQCHVDAENDENTLSTNSSMSHRMAKVHCLPQACKMFGGCSRDVDRVVHGFWRGDACQKRHLTRCVRFLFDVTETGNRTANADHGENSKVANMMHVEGDRFR